MTKRPSISSTGFNHSYEKLQALEAGISWALGYSEGAEILAKIIAHHVADGDAMQIHHAMLSLAAERDGPRPVSH